MARRDHKDVWGAHTKPRVKGYLVGWVAGFIGLWAKTTSINWDLKLGNGLG